MINRPASKQPGVMKDKYSCPSVPMGIGPGPLQMPKSMDAHVPCIVQLALRIFGFIRPRIDSTCGCGTPG